MAEPGDPKTPAEAQDETDHDAHVGFVSPASLAGRARAAEPVAAPEPDDEPDLFDPPLPPERLSPQRLPPEPGPFDRSEGVQPVARFAPHSPPRAAAPHAAVREQMRAETSRAPDRVPGPAAPMRLYAVYVLILLAVPTLGASCLLALLAVMRRDTATDALETSHAQYQRRTVFGAIATALIGAGLVVVNIGVIVLFAVAIWILARGAYGVLKLKSGQAVPRPRSWLF
ncbi:MAG: hypothetical protein P0Y50_00615 [Candidatus Brevundimonas colombiensis]|uniref:DUF4870 domain-containing protein n=1 Tax=Candidatus Brevundimonas colombiensis TaxID=3121376 RepID=A0AAJ5WXI2_9CAUL|nr:hypothetical protein [Brevundimonas sp.]WEK40136.1 MAG: hypothetical protein P0Y50_00615 [Brevundimonas sp.]